MPEVWRPPLPQFRSTFPSILRCAGFSPVPLTGHFAVSSIIVALAQQTGAARFSIPRSRR